jgi:hypothetical protein
VNFFSSGNRFYDNGAGTLIFGGLSSNNTRADGNTINFEAHGDQFVGNTGATEFDHGGLFVLGIEDVSDTGGGSNNTVNIQLWGCRMLDNDLTDLTGVGARSLSESKQSLSQNNHVTIEIPATATAGADGSPWSFLPTAYPSQATVIRSLLWTRVWIRRSCGLDRGHTIRLSMQKSSPLLHRRRSECITPKGEKDENSISKKIDGGPRRDRLCHNSHWRRKRPVCRPERL